MINRRQMLQAGAAVAGGAAILNAGARSASADYARHQYRWDKSYSGEDFPEGPFTPGLPGKHYKPVIVPGGKVLPWKIVDGVKVYHLISEEVEQEFCPAVPGLPDGLRARCWGYNGTVNGPVIEAVEGDRVRIYVTNRLAAPTAIHWHGVFLPNGMDGVGGLTQRSIAQGETFKYEWTWKQHGTYIFHAHHDEMTQMGMGQTGMIVVHPRNPEGPPPERDFSLMLHEWKIVPGTRRPDPNEMSEFNILTINGKCFPGTAPLVCKTGDRVRIRIANLGTMDHHPFHIHGCYFKVVETDGGQIPPSAQQRETTVLVAVGQTRAVEFVADFPGDWAMHCHMTHHVMNQMGHGLPNMIGMDPGRLDDKVTSLLPDYMTMGQDGMGDMASHVHMGHMKVPANSIPMIGGEGPFDYITMGGMFTILKVRDKLPKAYDDDPTWNEDPGWYEHPKGTVASRASLEELQHDLGAGPG
jgi:hypothetical protein